MVTMARLRFAAMVTLGWESFSKDGIWQPFQLKFKRKDKEPVAIKETGNWFIHKKAAIATFFSDVIICQIPGSNNINYPAKITFLIFQMLPVLVVPHTHPVFLYLTIL